MSIARRLVKRKRVTCKVVQVGILTPHHWVTTSRWVDENGDMDVHGEWDVKECKVDVQKG